MKKREIITVLRNPYGIDQSIVRAARVEAADLIVQQDIKIARLSNLLKAANKLTDTTELINEG